MPSELDKIGKRAFKSTANLRRTPATCPGLRNITSREVRILRLGTVTTDEGVTRRFQPFILGSVPHLGVKLMKPGVYGGVECPFGLLD